MRHVVVALLAASAVPLVMSAPAAQAQPYDNYPFCIKVYGPDFYQECSFPSLEACNATASGRAAQCFTNPFFVEGAPPRGRRRNSTY